MVLQGDLKDSLRGQEPTSHFVLWLPAFPSRWAEEGEEQGGDCDSYRVNRKWGVCRDTTYIFGKRHKKRYQPCAGDTTIAFNRHQHPGQGRALQVRPVRSGQKPPSCGPAATK